MFTFSTLKRLCATALTLSLGAVSLPIAADAGSATANLGVTVLIAAVCTINTTPVNFGTYDGSNVNLTTALTAAGTVTTTCTTGAVPTIALGIGLNGAATQRKLKQGTFLLNYSLFQPPSATPNAACNYASPTGWGDGTAATSGTTFATPAATSIASRSYNVCGSIPAGQDQPSSTTAYTDTVLATVTF